GRAFRRAGRLRRSEVAVIANDLEAAGRAALAADDARARHGADRRQRLAAKPEAPHAEEIVRAVDLARRVARERERQILARHPAAVVDDADLALASLRDLDDHAARAGIDRVLDQLLHDRGRPLDHLAGRDLVDHRLGKNANAAHAPAGSVRSTTRRSRTAS